MIATTTTTRTGTSTGTKARGCPKASGRQPSEQAIDAAIDGASRLLRLPTMRDRYAEIAEAAGREQLSYRAFLAELLLAECDERDARRAVRRIESPRELWRLRTHERVESCRHRGSTRTSCVSARFGWCVRLGSRSRACRSTPL